MERVEAYLNLNVSYKDFYIENNEDLKKDDCGIDKIYIAISLDLDIVFSALNIMPSKAGYQYWKEAVFLYMMSG